MKVIKLHYPKIDLSESTEPCAVALGFFDGLHQGHQKVIQTMSHIAESRGLKKGVVTFDPHPSVVLDPTSKRTSYITPLEVKLNMLRDMGIDYAFVIQFSSDFRSITPEDFVENYLIENKAEAVITGFDFTYGKYGEGNVDTLKEYTAFDTTVIERCDIDGVKISTTQILQDLKEHRITEANRALGRPFALEGLVVQGEKMGRTIGFPTANIELKYRYQTPANGVYVVKLKLNAHDKVISGVCNVGVKPTIAREKHTKTIEVHLLDFDRDIYGEEVTVYFLDYLRNEEKFDGLDALKAKINEDVETARKILEDH